MDTGYSVKLRLNEWAVKVVGLIMKPERVNNVIEEIYINEEC